MLPLKSLVPVPVTVTFPGSVGFVGIDNVTAASAFVTVIWFAVPVSLAFFQRSFV